MVAALALATHPVAAKTLSLIVPGAPGGGISNMGHYLSAELEKNYNQPAIVENMNGAGGIIAINALKKTPIDGDTLMLTNQLLSIFNFIFVPELSYSLDDFETVATLAETPTIMISHLQDFQEFVKQARAKPGTLNVGVGTHSLGYVLAHAIKVRYGIDFNIIPYRGAPGNAQLVNDVLGNHINVAISTLLPTALPLINDYKLFALAQSTRKRSFWIRYTPTFADIGMVELESASVYAVVVRKGTSDEIVSNHRKLFKKIIDTPDFGRFVEGQGLERTTMTPENYLPSSQKSVKMWSDVMDKMGIKRE